METAIARCDKLNHSGHLVEALGTISSFKDETDPEVQWRLARAIFKEAEHKGPGPKEKAITKTLNMLDKGLAQKENSADMHVWYAIILGSKDKHESFKQKIEEAFVVREHVDKCIAIEPDSWLGYHVLGNWCYQVASVPWIQKKTAATLFAKPPDASLDEALEAFKKAEQLCPDIFNNNHLMMAKVLLDMGKKKEAQEYLKKCLVLDEERKTDHVSLENIEEAKKLIKKHGFKI